MSIHGSINVSITPHVRIVLEDGGGLYHVMLTDDREFNLKQDCYTIADATNVIVGLLSYVITNTRGPLLGEFESTTSKFRVCMGGMQHSYFYTYTDPDSGKPVLRTFATAACMVQFALQDVVSREHS